MLTAHNEAMNDQVHRLESAAAEGQTGEQYERLESVEAEEHLPIMDTREPATSDL